MVKTVRFKIDPSGEVSIDVEGAVGSQCDTLTRDFEKALGTVQGKQRKDAYYTQGEQVTETTTQEAGQGV